MTRIGACSIWRKVAAATVFLVASNLAFAANRLVIDLQVRVQAMSDQAMIMQQSMDQNFGSMTQSLKNVTAGLVAVQKKLARFMQTVPAQGQVQRNNSVTSQMTTLMQSASELGASVQQLEHQAQTLSAEIGVPAQPVPAPGQVPSPDVLFSNGMEDYDAGRYKLASQEFAEYMKFYSATTHAARAQFYLADSEYWAGDYQAAVQDFDKLEENYPATDTATVELKKGLSFMNLAEIDAARDEFRQLIERYPKSAEAIDARSQLQAPGIGPSVDLSHPGY
ncbi:MAG: tetratricopeptide repeat protein [Terriglobales bacterium]